jgi:CRISPR-associated protein Cmr4
MKSTLILFRTVTPLHIGVGQAAGVVDLPIMREKATNWPIIPGSSLKGVLRDRARSRIAESMEGESWKDKLEKADRDPQVASVYGTSAGEGSAGFLGVTDLRCLFFPVRSFSGTFAYVCSPLSLQRLMELYEVATGKKLVEGWKDDGLGDTCRLTNDSKLAISGKVVLEDVDLSIDGSDRGPLTEVAKKLAEFISPSHPHRVIERVVQVPDTIFTFLTESATEVVTHVTLEMDTKTAKKGMLRQDESVPAEAVFAGLAVSLTPSDAVDNEIKDLDGLIQLGGKASTGLGLGLLKQVRGS